VPADAGAFHDAEEGGAAAAGSGAAAGPIDKDIDPSKMTVSAAGVIHGSWVCTGVARLQHRTFHGPLIGSICISFLSCLCMGRIP
jgi:hypothetical protein